MAVPTRDEIYKLMAQPPNREVFELYCSIGLDIGDWQECWMYGENWQTNEPQGASEQMAVWMFGKLTESDVKHIGCKNTKCANPLHLIQVRTIQAG